MSQQNTEQPLHTLLRKNPPFRADQVGSLLAAGGCEASPPAKSGG